MKCVVIESPFSPSNGRTTDQNIAYGRAALLDSLSRGEAPYASHLLYTQVLDDTDIDERRTGMQAGFVWGSRADLVAVYIDHTITRGMLAGMKRALSRRCPMVFRSLHGVTGTINVSMEGGPYPVEIGKVWTPPDPIEVLVDLLGLVDHAVPYSTVRAWTRKQRDEASDWAAAVHLEASDNDVTVPDRPAHLAGFEQMKLFGMPVKVDERLKDGEAAFVGDDGEELHRMTGLATLGVHDNRPPDDPERMVEEHVHLWAMGGLETVCGIRSDTITGTMSKRDVSCPGCLHRTKTR